MERNQKSEQAAADVPTSMGGGQLVVVLRSLTMKPRVRRFEPQGGVSRPMIEAEAKYVAREMENYLLLSMNDLKQKLAERGAQWNQADESLHAMVSLLPGRERLALQSMLVRDMMLLLELYLEYVRRTEPEAPPPITPADVPQLGPSPDGLFISTALLPHIP
jgi:hypothetical protein